VCTCLRSYGRFISIFVTHGAQRASARDDGTCCFADLCRCIYTSWTLSAVDGYGSCQLDVTALGILFLHTTCEARLVGGDLQTTTGPQNLDFGDALRRF
jgi:hypothetical protein